jgi:two-component system phosphate regulon sensor histidine kinase PhoR
VLGPSDRVRLVRELDLLPGSSRPGYVKLGGVEYRGVAAALRDSDPRITLAVLRERGAVEAAASDVRKRILAVGGVALACVGVLAYLFAPALARTRLRRRQRVQAERVLSRLSDGVVEVDDDGRVTYINPAAASLAGIDARAVLGRPVEAAVPGWREIEATTSPGESAAVPIELDGREHWLSVAVVATDAGTVYAFRDVTRERRLEEMRAELVATVSHELRTPLAAVYGAAMTLQRAGNVDDATRNQLIGVVGNQAERLARIVDDILTASRAAVEADEESAAPLDARALAESAVHDAAERTGRPIELDAGQEPLVALGREDDVRRVLGNLIDNAVKYSQGEPRIRVELAPAGHQRYAVRVTDNGVGISPAELKRIFKRFYRIPASVAVRAKGSGLGLFIVRSVARKHGGRAFAESAGQGQGSTFTLLLPEAPG